MKEIVRKFRSQTNVNNLWSMNGTKYAHAYRSKWHSDWTGALNPLSSRRFIKCCVLPVLLYSAESLTLNQSKTAKRRWASVSSISPSPQPTTLFEWHSNGLPSELVCCASSWHFYSRQWTPLIAQVLTCSALSLLMMWKLYKVPDNAVS